MQRSIEVLTRDECLQQIRSQQVGRIVFVDESGPGAVPVNFGVADNEIVLRVESDSNMRALVDQSVAFEVDDIHSETGAGWSVLIRGRAREVPLAEVSSLLKLMHEGLPRPWVEGVHSHWLAIGIDKATGRRLTESS